MKAKNAQEQTLSKSMVEEESLIHVAHTVLDARWLNCCSASENPLQKVSKYRAYLMSHHVLLEARRPLLPYQIPGPPIVRHGD